MDYLQDNTHNHWPELIKTDLRIDFREFCEMINKKAEEDAAAAHK